MRWPFGPPHLTLKPSKKNKKKKKKTKKNKKKKQTKKTQKKKEKNTKIPNKELFSYQSNFLFWVGVQKLPLFDNLAQKTRTPKHYKNRGFSLFFGKKLCVTKRPFLDQKNPNSEIPVTIFVCLFSLSKTKNTQKSAETPFQKCFSKPKKENFQKLT